MDTSGHKPTFISTFAGTGGSSLGYHWAGFKELLAIDFDSHAVECFRLNFPEVPCWQRDITTVTAKEILDFCKIKEGDLDVFDGSPPCQGFSTAGKRQVNDPRNYLFEAYIKLVHELQPKVFVMENVSGMAKGKMKGQFIRIMQTLKSLNYRVKAKQMNAMYYGVPQSRERIIFIGVRKDLEKDSVFPEPSNKIITAKQAIGEIKNTGKVFIPTAPKVLALMGKMKPGQCGTDIPGNKTGFQMLKLDPNRPCPTVTKTCTGTWFSGMFHYSQNRYLTIKEVCVLCSFPEDWILTGSFQQQWSRLGNAVMPKFMQAIAKSIRTNILSS